MEELKTFLPLNDPTRTNKAMSEYFIFTLAKILQIIMSLLFN